MSSIFDFEDVRVSERRLYDEVHRRMQAIDAEISATQRAQAIQHAPGFADFILSIEALIQRSTTELVTTTKSNEYMRQLQGRVQALRDIATLLTRGKILLEELAKRRQAVQDDLAELQRRAPQRSST